MLPALGAWGHRTFIPLYAHLLLRAENWKGFAE